MSGNDGKHRTAGGGERDACSRGLRPLIERIEEYDSARRQLETVGGRLSDISAIRDLLDNPVTIRHGSESYTVRLTEHEQLRRILGRIGDGGIRFDVRIRGTGMPAYYLCRTESDYAVSSPFIVEDLHRSPGYPSFDDRFCRLMYLGRESCLLRVSHLREGTERLLYPTSHADAGVVDDMLLAIGREVLRSAWHEDQLSGILTSKHFGLRSFRDAIELIYLCLGADLCGLRTSVDARMLEFFATVYPQPAIRSFLEALRERAGKDLGGIEQSALRCYGLLSREYAAFLRTEVRWKPGGARHPLFTFVFGNFYRLESLAGLVAMNTELGRAVARLESSSEHMISSIVGSDVAARVA